MFISSPRDMDMDLGMAFVNLFLTSSTLLALWKKYPWPGQEEEGRVRDLHSLEMAASQLQGYRGVQVGHQEGGHFLYLNTKQALHILAPPALHYPFHVKVGHVLHHQDLPPVLGQ